MEVKLGDVDRLSCEHEADDTSNLFSNWDVPVTFDQPSACYADVSVAGLDSSL